MIVKNSTRWGYPFITFKAHPKARHSVSVSIKNDCTIYVHWGNTLSELQSLIISNNLDYMTTLDDAKDFAQALDEAINYVKRLQE